MDGGIRVYRSLVYPPDRTQVFAASFALCDFVDMSQSQPVSDRNWFAPALLAVATLACYANSFDGTFVYDDEPSILNNPAVQTLWEPASGANRERPLAIWTFAVNFAISEFDVFSYHAVNTLVHWFAGVFMWLLFKRLLATEAFSEPIRRRASMLALAAAMLWVVHPLNTQAVTYVVQRMESLASLFMLVALYAIARAEGRWSRWWALAAVAAVAGIWTKPIVLTLPVLAILVDRVVAKDAGYDFTRRAALSVLLLVCVVGPNARYLVGASKSIGREKTEGQIASAETNSLKIGATANEIIGGQQNVELNLKREPTSWEYLRSQPEVLLHYLRLVFWPSGQTLDYDWPVQNSLVVSFALGLIVLALFAVAAWLVWTSPGWGLLAMWPFIVLGPTSSILPIQDLAYEHRMYLPLVAIVTMVVLGVYDRFRRSTDATTLGTLFAVAVLALGIATIRRNEVYNSAESVWANVVTNAPWNARAWNNLAFIHLQAGDDKRAAYGFEQAQKHEDVPIRRLHILHNAAFARYNLGEYERAVELANEAQQIAEGAFALPHFIRGSVGVKLGFADDAVLELNQAIRMEPEFPGSYFIRGQAHLMLADDDRFDAAEQNRLAVEDFEKMLEIDPGRHSAIVNLAIALGRLGRDDDSIAQFSKAIEMQPDDWALYVDRGNIYRRQKNYAAALRDFEIALSNSPNLSPAWQGMVGTLVDIGQIDAARPIAARFEQLGGKLPAAVKQRLTQPAP